MNKPQTPTRCLKTVIAGLLVPAALALSGCAPGAGAAPLQPTSAPAEHAAPGSALAVLESIPVKGRAPKTGYSRAQFGPAWKDIDHNGCDQRNDLLRAQLQQVQLKPGTHGCVVLSGVYSDPYTGQNITFIRGGASELDVDHLVPLRLAWVQGAQNWDQDTRERFASDMANLALSAASANRSKGDSDLASWLPPNRGFWCTYTSRIVTVKAAYNLSMTQAEHDTARRILTNCPTK